MALPVTITGISTSTTAMPVGPFKVSAGNYAFVAIDTAINAGFGVNIQGTGANTAGGQTLTNPNASSLVIPSVQIPLFKTGSPTDNIYVEVTQTDINGTVLATSANVAASTITATTYPTAQLTTFTFSSPPTISASATFAVRIKRTGAGDTSNYLSGTGQAVASYAGGTLYTYNGTTWASGASDVKVIVNGTTTIASDAYYFFGRDSTTGTTLQCYKSTAPDTSWSSVTTKTGFTTGILNIAGYQADTIIHLAVQDGTLSSSVATKYLSFNAASDTFLATVETVATASTVTGQASAGWGVDITVRPSDGFPVILYNGAQVNTSGTPYARVYYRVRTGLNTYGTATRVDTATAIDSLYPRCVLGDSSRAHFFWANVGGSNRICHRSLTSGGTLNTANVTTGPAPSNAPTDMRAISYNNAGTIYIANYQGNLVPGSNQCWAGASADSPTFTIDTSMYSSGSPSCVFGTPFYDNGNLYSLCCDANASFKDAALWTSTDNGASFGSTFTYVMTANLTTTVNVFSKHGTVYQRGSDIVIPYIVNDNGTIKYNEWVLRSIAVNYDFQAGLGEFTLAGVNVTLRIGRKFQAGTGTFSLGGQNVTLRVGRKFQAGTGAFNLSGQNVTLRVARKMQAGTGTFNLTGQNVDLTYTAVSVTHYTMSALTGSFTLNGQNVGLRRDYRLSPTAGAFALGGQNATLRFAHKMQAGTGAFNLNGQDATLRVGRVAKTTVGAFTLGGQNVILKYARKALAGTGAFNLNGQNVTLTYTTAAKVLTALTGAFTLGGQNVVLRVARKAVTTVGTFTVNSQNVVLRATRVAKTTVGAFNLNGQNVNLAYGRKAVTGTGVFNLSGQPITFRLNRNLKVSAGAFTLSGQPVNLLLGRRLTVSAGSFTLNGQPVVLRATRKMQAGIGAFTVNGQNVFLGYSGGGRILSAQSGTFDLGGQNVTLRYTRKLFVTAGQFTLAGSTTLRLNRNIAVTAGAFTLNGQPVVLRYAHRAVTTVGTFNLNGQNVVLRYARKAVTTPGAFVLTGQPVSLRPGRQMSVTPGVFLLDGKNVVLRTGLRVQVGTGAFLIDGKPVDLKLGGGLLSGVKVWSGSVWAEKPAKVWTGSVWVTKPVKTWSGSAWV